MPANANQIANEIIAMLEMRKSNIRQLQQKLKNFLQEATDLCFREESVIKKNAHLQLLHIFSEQFMAETAGHRDAISFLSKVSAGGRAKITFTSLNNLVAILQALITNTTELLSERKEQFDNVCAHVTPVTSQVNFQQLKKNFEIFQLLIESKRDSYIDALTIIQNNLPPKRTKKTRQVR